MRFRHQRGRFWLTVLSLAAVFVLVAACGTATSDSNTGTNDPGTGGGQAQPQPAEPVVLKAITSWPENVTDNAGFFHLRDLVNERGEGIVQLEYLGGPEVIPTNEQIEAVRSGTVDIMWGSAAYTDSIVPEANFLKLTPYTPQEERENGLYDLLDEVFRAKANAHYLGRGVPGVPFHFYTVDRIERMADFEGKIIRVTPNYRDFAAALGASPLTIAPGEVYTALQRNAVDGLGWPAFGITDWGWEEVIRYRLDPGFYEVDAMGLINADTWEALPEEAREIITAAAVEMEAAMQEYFADVVSSEEERLREAGVEVVRLPEEEVAAFGELAHESLWPLLLEASPEYGPRFEELLRK